MEIPVFFFKEYGDHRDLHVRLHSFPTRRSSDLVAGDAALEERLPHQRISRGVLEQASARHRGALDTGAVEQFAPTVGAFGVRDVYGLGIKRKPPRAQSGDCRVARAVGDLDEQILALLSRHWWSFQNESLKSDLHGSGIRVAQSAVARGAWLVIDL